MGLMKLKFDNIQFRSPNSVAINKQWLTKDFTSEIIECGGGFKLYCTKYSGYSFVVSKYTSTLQIIWNSFTYIVMFKLSLIYR